MNGNPDGLGILAKRSKLPANRIDYHSEADEQLAALINRGILFLVAFWSGPSFAAFTTLTEIVARMDCDSKLEFVVADIDGSPSLHTWLGFGEVPGGYGEAAWIKNGKVMAATRFDIASYEPNTLSLLSLK